MVFNPVCAADGPFFNMINSFTLPLLVGGAILGGIIIALVSMLGESIHNPKVSLWSKTELVQLFASVIATLIVIQGINLFCTINLVGFIGLFNVDIDAAKAPAASINLFDGAELYLRQAASYNRDLLIVTRYHLAAYNILESRYLAECGQGDGVVGRVAKTLGCLFGSATGLGAGTAYSSNPESGYSLVSPAIFLSFNTIIFSYLSTLNYLFILKYIFNGLLMFFLPIGVFIRSIPYMRGLGSLLIAVSVAFLFIYPLVLSLFYIDFLARDPVLIPSIPGEYINANIASTVTFTTALNPFNLELRDDVFPHGSQEKEIMGLTANAFLVGVFIPSIAMLAAVASTVYLTRLLGEEIDLSRVIQMV